MESSTGDPVSVAGPPLSSSTITPHPPDGKPAAVSVVKSISAIAQRLNGESVQRVGEIAAPAGDVVEVGSNSTVVAVKESVPDGESAVVSTMAAPVVNDQAIVSGAEPEVVSEPDVRNEEVRTEPGVAEPVTTSQSGTRTEPVTAEMRTESVSSEGNFNSIESASKQVTVSPSHTDNVVEVEDSSNPVPKETEINVSNEKPGGTSSPIRTSKATLLNEAVVPSTDAPQPQVISTIQNSPLSEQGSTANNEGEAEVTQIISKPVSAMLSSSSSRKNRRKAARPMQINRERTNDEIESSSQESNGGGDVNIESMIHAASDITDFCDIANRFLGGDDSQDELTTPPESSTPPDNNQAVPVQEMAQVAIARQQNIPISTQQTTPSHSMPILRQSILPVRHRTSSPTQHQQRASPSNQQRKSSPSPQQIACKVYKPAQQIIRHMPQQQQVIQQPQQYIMQQQPVQGKITAKKF